jgi:NIMA (never in mitosis gene a)-related kinase
MSKIEILDHSDPNEMISINGFIIKERIGVGSYGRVYKVYKNKMYYVLKEIPLNLSTAAEKINSVQNEAQILSSLNNKYVVKFYESFKMNNNIYILMEYCDNGDLCSFLNKVKKSRKDENYFLDEDFVWKLFIQMSIGLYYIHSKKIIHRDIKTLNIFLTKNYDAKIGDLGVAKLLEDTNHANTFIGTPYYVSPEMCKNKPYNEKSDIWALGCILYELLTFNHPFTANNQPALFIKIINSKINPFPPGVPDDLKSMVEFILQKNCEERPTMEEIITSYNFQYNAIRIGLEKDLKKVLGVDKLQFYKMNKMINSNGHSFKQFNNISKNANDLYLKNKKNNLLNSKSVNPLNLNKKSFVCNNIFKNNKIAKKKTLFKKKKHNNEQNCNSNENCSHIRLIKNNDIKADESVHKRTKSEFNNILKNISNSAKKNANSKSFKNNEIKNYKENKKISLISSMYKINQKKYNISPRKTKYIKSKGKQKELSDKEAHSVINYNINNNMFLERFNTGSKLNENLNNYNLKICDTSRDKIKSNKYYNKKEIKIDGIINGQIKKPLTVIKKEDTSNKKENNEINTDIITEYDFMKELNNRIKNSQMIVNLNDLLNHNFNPEDTKNLNTTSATTLLEKNENPVITIIENNNNNNIIKNELNNKEKDKKNIKNILEEEKTDFFAGACDEFTYTEMIQKDEPYLINRIPLSNYEIKINDNKNEINNIIDMSKDEIMKTYFIYKNKYEKYLEKVKKYLNVINLNEIKKMYSNLNTLNDKEIKKIVNSIVNYTRQKYPGQNIDELVDNLYHMISYDIKYKITKKKLI